MSKNVAYFIILIEVQGAMPYRKIIAQNLIDFRKKEHISQMELAFRTDISRETISLIEREEANLRIDTISKITAYTGLTAAELLTENYVRDNMNDEKED